MPSNVTVVKIDEDELRRLTLGRGEPVWVLLERLGAKVERQTKVLLSMPGTGRVYVRGRGRGHGRRGGVMHRASAPGQPPAVDTGRLRASITHQVGGPVYNSQVGIALYVRVGTGVAYARYLEFGTSRMAARPFLVRGIALAGVSIP
jgi:hypothetical protein